MSLTITIPGAVNVTTGAMAPAVLTIGVGVPGAQGPQGPAGPGVPAGGTAGQFLTKIDGTNYNTDWTTVNLSAYAVKANNLSDLTNFGTARTNLGLGSLAVVNDAPSDGSQYARKNAAWEVVTTTPDYISSVSSPLSVTTGNLTINLAAYAPLASPAFTGNPTAPTAALGDNDTSIATTAFVQQELLSGTANARNLEVYVRNQTGSTIPAGSVVYINGATGNRPTITLAQANNDANSAQTFGFVKASIANNGFGFVIVRGELENVDTSALTEGVQLYLSPTVAGAYTTTKPSAPQHLVYVGICVRAHPTQGVILVAVQNGYELPELHDVKITSPTNGQVLKYDSAQSLWVNGTDSSGVAWGAVTGTLSAQTDLQSALDAKLAVTTAASTYQTIAGMSSYLTTSAAASTYSPIASPTFTGLATFDNPGNYAISVPASGGAGYDVRIEGQLISLRNAGTELIRIGTGGIKYPDGVTQSVAFPGFAGYAPLASPALTGNVTITSNSSGAALFIEQAGAGNILTLHDQATDTNFVAIDANGKVSTIPSEATNGAGFNIAHGVAPTTPVNGDIWTTTSGLFARINAGTQQFAALSTNNTFSNASSTYGSSTAAGTLNFGTGATISGATKAVNIGTAGVSGSTTNIIVGPVLGASTTSIGNTTAASTLNLATGATLTATTKAVNIGTSGVAGSTTTIAIGSTTGTSTTTLQGTTNGITAAVDTNSVALATTAYVVGQAGSATPLVDGTAAVGTSLRYARQDHVHPTDTSRAPLASPTFTGTPTLPTGTIATTQSPGNNTTAVATTAFVTAAVPAFATTAQVVAATSTTTALAPGNQGFLLTNPRLQPLAFFNQSSISGSGVSSVSNVQNFSRQIYLGSLATGRAALIFGIIGTANAGFGTSTAKADQVDFSKKVWISGYAMMGYSGSPSYLGDANTMCRITLGGYSTNTTGEMTLKGIGLKKVGGVASTVSLTVHNGTTLTDVASSVTIAEGAGIHWQIYSDGTGNVTLYINGTQAATTTAGPTTATASGQACYREQVEAVATPGVRQLMSCNGGWFYTE